MRTAIVLIALAPLCSAQSPAIRPLSPAAPGSWLTITGGFLADTDRSWSAADFQGAALPTSLDSVRATVNGKSAAIAYVSPSRVHLLIPGDAGAGTVPLTITNPRGASTTSQLQLQPIAPQWLAGPLHANGAPITISDPAEPGETIVAYGTGFGPTSPAVDPMTIFTGAAPLATPTDLTFTLAGQPANVAFAGITGNGLYQVNIVVPPLPEGLRYELTAAIRDSRSTLPLAVVPPGPPAISSLTPNDLIWGQEATVVLNGTGLQGPNTIRFSDANQLTLFNGPYPGQAFSVRVEENATPGTRTLTVTNRKGESNPVPITIRRGEPRITALSPATAWPGRVYPLRIDGVDTAAVRTVEVSPAAAIRAQFGLLQLDEKVPTGPYQLRLRSPWDASPPVPLLVAPPPPTAPAISALSPIQIRRYSPITATELADYSAEFDFTDRDGDVKTGARVEILVELNGEIQATNGIIELLPKPGAARFICTQSTRTSRPGPFPVWITLIDEAGNRSNALQGTVDVWWN